MRFGFWIDSNMCSVFVDFWQIKEKKERGKQWEKYMKNEIEWEYCVSIAQQSIALCLKTVQLKNKSSAFPVVICQHKFITSHTNCNGIYVVHAFCDVFAILHPFLKLFNRCLRASSIHIQFTQQIESERVRDTEKNVMEIVKVVFLWKKLKYQSSIENEWSRTENSLGAFAIECNKWK